MMKLAIVEADGRYEVWLRNPEIEQGEGLLIGDGRTVPLAMNDARIEFVAALHTLEQASFDSPAPEAIARAGGRVELVPR